LPCGSWARFSPTPKAKAIFWAAWRQVGHERLAGELRRSSDLDGAVAEYRVCPQLDPGSPDCHEAIVEIDEDRGSAQDELQEFQRYLRAVPGGTAARFNFARVLANDGQLSNAAAVLMKLSNGGQRMPRFTTTWPAFMQPMQIRSVAISSSARAGESSGRTFRVAGAELHRYSG
jgi:predicted Zn-dependent protease